MKSFGAVKTIDEAKREAIEKLDVWYPGRINGPRNPNPSPFEEAEEFPPLPELFRYTTDWTRPKRVTGIPGAELTRYSTGDSFRRWGKESIGRRLRIIPSYHNEPQPGFFEQGLRIKVPYTVFLDGVPSFGEIPFGATTSKGQTPAKRGIWGELVSGISKKGGDKMFAYPIEERRRSYPDTGPIWEEEVGYQAIETGPSEAGITTPSIVEKVTSPITNLAAGLGLSPVMGLLAAGGLGLFLLTRKRR